MSFLSCLIFRYISSRFLAMRNNGIIKFSVSLTNLDIHLVTAALLQPSKASGNYGIF